MLVVTPCHVGDIDALRQLLLWIQKLGACKAHQLLLVADAGTPIDKVVEVMELAGQVFGEVRLVTNPTSVIGWPDGCYSLFNTATKYISEHWPQPFLILEPDAIPLKPGWLDQIEQAYQKSGTPFMGCIYDAPGFGSHGKCMSGIAVYPPNAVTLLPPCPLPVPWDMYGADVMTGNGSHTPLIKHFFGQHKLPPTFVHEKSELAPINAFTLDWLGSECVLFHRDKTHSLIPLLARKLGIEWQHAIKHEPVPASERLVLVLGFCWNDQYLALKNLYWMIQLGGRVDGTIVLQTDMSVSKEIFNTIVKVAGEAFTHVVPKRLPTTTVGWPQGSNMLWQSAGRFMASLQKPWIWSEPDAVFVKEGWLELLSDEYLRADKPFMGHVVGGMGHMNGVGVYPADVGRFAPHAMTCTNAAFDMVLHPAIAPHVHKANHLIRHCRAAVNGCCLDQHGQPPVFRSAADLSMVGADTVLFHPSKDGSLIDRLNEKL
jgi:hypothetical protein